MDFTYYYAIKLIMKEVELADIPVLFRDKAKDLVTDNYDELLEQAKIFIWENIKAIRDNKETSGCPFNGSVIDSDERSVVKINTAVASAQIIGEDFTIDWTMQDNSVMTLDYTAMLSVPVVLAQYSNALHQKARQLKEKIENATTVEEVWTISWDD